MCSPEDSDISLFTKFQEIYFVSLRYIKYKFIDTNIVYF